MAIKHEASRQGRRGPEHWQVPRRCRQGSRALWEAADPSFQPVPDVLLFHQSDLELGSEELNVLLNLMKQKSRSLPQRRSRTILTTQPPVKGELHYTAGKIDIKAAEQALGKSQNKNVKASFAEEMVRDHEAVNKKAIALLDKLSVKPEDNDTSKALADAASKKQEELSLTINVGGATAREITYV